MCILCTLHARVCIAFCAMHVAGKHAHVCTGMWGPEDDLRHLSSSPIYLSCLETGFLTDLEATKWARLAGHQEPGILLLYSPEPEVGVCSIIHAAFKHEFWHQTQVSVLEGQALYTLNRYPSPASYLLHSHVLLRELWLIMKCYARVRGWSPLLCGHPYPLHHSRGSRYTHRSLTSLLHAKF